MREDEALWHFVVRLPVAMSRHLALTLLAALCSCASAAKVLVLYDDPLVRSTHSRYFAGLQSQGHTVTVKSATDGSLKLKDWDDWMYEKLILFAPSATGGRRLLVRLICVISCPSACK